MRSTPATFSPKVLDALSARLRSSAVIITTETVSAKCKFAKPMVGIFKPFLINSCNENSLSRDWVIVVDELMV